MTTEMENILARLRSDKNRLKTNYESIYTVSNSIAAIIDRFYDQNSIYKTELRSIYDRNQVFKMQIVINHYVADSLGLIRQNLENVIDNIISEIELLGLPKPQDIKIDKSINVVNTLTQHQEQNQNVSFAFILEALKIELTGRQLKEIEEIVSAESDPEKAKPKIQEKLKSFGESLLSNIMANIITNPTVWTGLGS